jgi:hypothetical protein
VLWMLLCSITSAAAQVSVDIGFPGVLADPLRS